MRNLYPDCRGHVVGADFSEVSTHDAVVKPVEQHDDTDVHGVLGLDPAETDGNISWSHRPSSTRGTVVTRDRPEEDVEAEHGEHDGQVAEDAHRVAQLVDQQEPLVNHPEKHRNT